MNTNKITYLTSHKWETTVDSELGVQVNLKKYKYFGGFSMSSDYDFFFKCQNEVKGLAYLTVFRHSSHIKGEAVLQDNCQPSIQTVFLYTETLLVH